MTILGISAFYHDSAACLVKDGEIVAAVSEERLSRKKYDPSFPVLAINYCLAEAGINSSDLDIVAFYEKPYLKFDRLLRTYCAYAPEGVSSFLEAMPIWTKNKLWIREIIREELNYDGEIIFPEHHQSHAASAFFPSPFEECTYITFDGVGEWSTTSFGTGRGNKVEEIADIRFPHSLGLLYSAFTYYTGFKVNSGEYKVMGLAPYGEPRYRDVILDTLMDLKPDGSFRLDMAYFNYCQGATMTSEKFHTLFGDTPREPETRLTQFHMDLARSVQDVCEEVMLRISRHAFEQTSIPNLCLAGGVALNCVGNGRILREGPYDNVWIQPASGDAGGALGAALFAWYQYQGNERVVTGRGDSQYGSYLGPAYSDGEIKSYLDENRIPYRDISGSVTTEVADLIADQNVIGWFQGRMEFGPRALGARSILGDARSPKMQEVMNLKIKFRESFRPFAPVVLAEKASDFFEMEGDSPYMLLTFYIRKELRREGGEEGQNGSPEGLEKRKVVRSTLPAVTHVDYSARVQTVHRETNPLFYDLLREFDNKHGSPVLINTSFNVRGEPIVCSPEDAYRCFMRTNMDYLVLGNFLLNKKDQPDWEEEIDWQEEFELD